VYQGRALLLLINIRSLEDSASLEVTLYLTLKNIKMSITITSSDQKQLEFIKRIRQFLDTHTEEQLNALPKDKKGFIDFFTIFKQEDEDKLFNDEVVIQKDQFSKPTGKVNPRNYKKSTLDLLDFKNRINDNFEVEPFNLGDTSIDEFMKDKI
tara:strand:+ start:224 stop:682 length:459 start_codon:yes stop_codon:yes gene_type:complete